MGTGNRLPVRKIAYIDSGSDNILELTTERSNGSYN